MKLAFHFLFLSLLFVGCSATSEAQAIEGNIDPVFIDNQGVLRWLPNKEEASFFGVNYTTPFAYSYRAQKTMGLDLKKVIRQDVYHMARLGLDAFRVHVWDTELSDSTGNLLNNEHLQLFDFLLAELKKREIKVIITPIAFWGNGYPEKDEKTPGFSQKYGKEKATRDGNAIKAQENYLQQFFTHINPYTKLTYGDDPNIIATELNNEPSHSGPKEGVTNYINRLAKAVRATGWTKPVYYNISQSPYYASAVAQSQVDGVSFQWYPAGLVANHERKGNYLPYVDRYPIPFDTIPAFRSKSLMVYEFDAADIMQSNMYPAMAKAFRQAGFQWATQFAYDPMELAYSNTEYQTHYLNLAYTPSKAISLLIASKVFHELPRQKDWGTYPSDSIFGPFRVSYRESLSEMNSEEEFYYSNTTHSIPVNKSHLKHVAGVGSSVVVQYEGTGSYFLDQMDSGVWRLEVMPDAVSIRDPFAKASPQKEVTRIVWNNMPMSVSLPDLGADFFVRGLNSGNNYKTQAEDERFIVSPGTYLLTREEKKMELPGSIKIKNIGLEEFVAPKPFSQGVDVLHEPLEEVSPGESFSVGASIVGIGSEDRVTLQINRLGGLFRTFKRLPMQEEKAHYYTAVVPPELVEPGVLQYKIIIQKGDDDIVFPGNHHGNPDAWDNINEDFWQSFVANKTGLLEIYNPTNDRNSSIYPVFKKGFQTGYTRSENPGQLLFRMKAEKLSDTEVMGFQFFFADKIKGRKAEHFDKIIVTARTNNSYPTKAKIVMTDTNGRAYGAAIQLTDCLRDIEIPVSQFTPDSALLLPRPYPGFLPLWYGFEAGSPPFDFSEAEQVQVILEADPNDEGEEVYSVEVASIRAEKNAQ